MNLSRYSLVLLLLSLFCSCKHAKKSKQVGPLCEYPASTDKRSLEEILSLNPENMLRKTGIAPLEDGGKSLIARAWLCEHAQKTMDIQYYIFSRDNTGLIASDFIIRAADRGVKIRLIIDDATVKGSKEEIQLLESHENIEIKVYNPGVKIGKLSKRIKKMVKNAGKLHRRMHAKSFIVDDKIAITGGRNIADEYFDYDKEYNFRDRDVMLIGKSVPDIKRSFEEYWNSKFCESYSTLVKINKKKVRDPNRFIPLHRYACDTTHFSIRMRNKIEKFPEEFNKMRSSGELIWTEDCNYVADIPGKNEEREDNKGGLTTDSLVALLKIAKKSVEIQSPYIILTEEGKTLFRELTKKGVKVRVLTNSLSSTDNLEAFSGYQRDRDGVLETGIEVYEFKPHPDVRYKLMTPEVQAAMSYTPVYGLHSKSMIIDGRITVIGSYNLDPRSANLNTECVVITREPEVAAILSRYIEEEFKEENSWRITKEFNPDTVAGAGKQIKAISRRVFPKKFL